MGRQGIVILTIVFTVLGCAMYANAVVLGTIEYNSAGSRLGEYSDIQFSIGYPIEIWSNDGHVLGIDFSTSFSWNVTESDVGKTLLANNQTHATFNDFVSFLKNGVDDIISLVNSFSLTPAGLPPNAMYESEYLNGIQDGVDFEGYTIESIALTINELFFDYDADAIKGGLTNYSCDLVYTIYGEPIPEPGTVLLLGIGAVAIIIKKDSRLY
jgi:hypothetical protein